MAVGSSRLTARRRDLRPPRRRRPAAIVAPLLQAAALLAAACAPLEGGAGRQAPAIRLTEGGEERRALELVGLDSELLTRLRASPPSDREWRRLCPVFTGETPPGSDSDQPAVLGGYRLEGDRLQFRPRFPLRPGLPYVLRCDLSELGGPVVESSFALPERKLQSTTRLLEIYPTANRLPENQLKFTLRFSAPMSRGEAYDHIRLLDRGGEPVERPFLVVEQELWDGAGERFTLFLDPGRIKRGLRPHREAGLPLVAGREYRLEVAADWRDATGAPLVAGFEKRFVAGPADRRAPDPADWEIEPPAAGRHASLRIGFPEPLDWALLERALKVVAPDGSEIAGRVEIGREERSWSLLPDRPWTAGRYRIEVDPVLEDLAGNNLRGLFDIELGVDPEEAQVDAVALPFLVE